ncbi:MAG: DUF2142 domain-containing protein [Faecalimonas sp.]|nr:DUF2142 domain-containing protein [Faecalimonas sp.]
MKKRGLRVVWNKTYILVAIVLWLLLTCSMLLAYREEWVLARMEPKYLSGAENSSDAEDIKIVLNDGDVLEQTIKIKEKDITGLSLFFHTPKQLEKGFLTVKLSEKSSGKVIEKWDKPANEIVATDDGSAKIYNFTLSEILNINANESYVIEVVANDISNNLLSVTSLNDVGVNDVGKKNGEVSDFVMEYKLFFGNHNALRFVGLAFYFGVTICIFGVSFFSMSGLKTEWIFVFFILVVGCLYMCLLPPYTVPDEPAHFITAYAQSNQLLGKEAVNEAGEVVVADEKLWGSNQIHPNKSSYDRYFRGVLGHTTESQHKDVTTRTPLAMGHAGYLPQVIGISVARVLNFNSEQLLFLGRLFALIWYAFIMYWAIKRMPFGKMGMFTIGALPMTLQMVVSYNYDSVLLGVCFFVFANLLHLIYEKDKVSWKDVILLTIAAIVIVQIKFIYLPIFCLALFIPKEKFGTLKWKIVSGSVIVAGSAATLLIQKWSTVQDSVTPHLTNTANPVQAISMAYIMGHPMEIMKLLLRTFEHNSWTYLSGMLASPLGWLELWVPNLVVCAFAILFLVCIAKEENKIVNVSASLRIVAFLIIAIMTLLGLLALILDCTPMGATTVWGYQGRYLLPALPLVIVLFQNKWIVLKTNIDKYLVLSLAYLHGLLIFYVSLIVISR